MTDYLDDKDRRIVTILQKDSRASVADMAKELNLTRATISKRMDRLIEKALFLALPQSYAKTLSKAKLLAGLPSVHLPARKKKPSPR